MWDWWRGDRVGDGSVSERNAQCARENRQLRRVNAALLTQLRDAGREIERLEFMVATQQQALAKTKGRRASARPPSAPPGDEGGEASCPPTASAAETCPTAVHSLGVSSFCQCSLLSSSDVDEDEEVEDASFVSAPSLAQNHSIAAMTGGNHSMVSCATARTAPSRVEVPSASPSPTAGPLPPRSHNFCVDGTQLPPLPPATKKYCVALDVDETQVHFSLEPFPTHKAELRFRGGIQDALQRLGALKDDLELGLWTAGVPRYAVAARELLSMVAQERKVFDWTIARDATWAANVAKKDLARLGRDLNYTLLIDNSRRVVVQRQNTLIVSNFYSMTRGTNDETLNMVADLVTELVLTNATVPEFLERKTRDGFLCEQGGYYHVPSSWPEALQHQQKRQMWATANKAAFVGNGRNDVACLQSLE